MAMLVMAMLVMAMLAMTACGGDDAMATVDAQMVDVPPNVPPRETIAEVKPLVVNEIVEAILHGGPGDYAHITMNAGGSPIDWNIHGHANGGTQVVAEQLKAASVDYVFVPTAEADWYLLIRNKGTTDINVDLKIELFGGVTWSGWQ
jgi:hypothetical protein